jgi:RIO kinase 1
MDTDREQDADTRIEGQSERPPGALARQAPAEKQSYEGSADVQRWLRTQALDAGGKPPFEPSLLAGRRDRDWILSSLGHFYERDLITDVLHEVSSGKEATVYCCAAAPATGAERLAAKIYRPRMFRSLRNDAVYRDSRAQYDRDGRPVRDGRRRGGGKTTRGRAAQVSSWIDYEFATHRLLHEAGADVPRPVSQVGNAVLMEYIGDDDGPAPLLHQVRLSREEARPLFDRLLRNIELWLAHDRIHGDLSAYNVLYRPGAVTIIDFAQALDPRHNPEIYPLFERDIERVCRHFARYGVAADPCAIAGDLWVRYIGGVL